MISLAWTLFVFDAIFVQETNIKERTRVVLVRGVALN